MKEMGMFTLIGKAEIKVHGKLSWELRCKCGTVVTKTTSDLNKLVSTSNCGCVGRKRSKPSLSVGDKFGMLTIKSIGDSDKHDKQMWNCQCECGNTCTKTTSDLRKAKIGSCGCVVYKIHGKANTPIYTTWRQCIKGAITLIRSTTNIMVAEVLLSVKNGIALNYFIPIWAMLQKAMLLIE